MRKKIYLFMLFCCSLMGCNQNNEPSYIRMSDNIVNKYINDMFAQHGLHTFARGGGFLDKINEIIITFQISGPKDQDFLRELIIKISEDLLVRFNDDENIRPFLKNYPFTADNLRIGIVLVDNNRVGIRNTGKETNLLYAIYQSYGKVKYYIVNDEKPNSQIIYEEPYEEALAIVNAK